jgi:1,4-alpha-glucan branching enzyme
MEGMRALRRTARPAPHALTADDLHLLNEGRHFNLHEKLGAHASWEEGRAGARFSVWAPAARSVSVIGDFNGWHAYVHRLEPLGVSGVWSGFVPGVERGARYKYAIESRGGEHFEKADPFATLAEEPPRTASVVWDRDYRWGDAEWMRRRAQARPHEEPVTIYELHLGSWRRAPDGRWLSYRELAERLPPYVRDLGYTHVELLPVMEHPFYGSWGYQTTGYFAPTSRYGTPQDFMALVDALHQAGIGVILDWVPAHFPGDPHGPAYFDGTHLFEHADPRQGFHPDWRSLIFNYGRNEVRSFLISSALCWIERFHADGLRVDAVASMLYLDYSRRPGEWIPNRYGGRENLEAIEFLRTLNEAAHAAAPGVIMIAEESTAWPMVSRPTWLGGLGFEMKWDMGWMHDRLAYFARDPVHRRFHQNQLTFRAVYAHHENFVLALSHDEVVHGKGSLLGRMPGDEWRRFANLRCLYADQYAQPGKKLLFMGQELAQAVEWNHEGELDWARLDEPMPRGVRQLVRELNRLCREEPALHRADFEPSGFEWVDAQDAERSVLTWLRRAPGGRDVLVVLNLTPLPRLNYRVGVPAAGRWTEILNTDALEFGGSGMGNLGGAEAAPVPMHGRPQSIALTLPPLAALYLRGDGEVPAPRAMPVRPSVTG